MSLSDEYRRDALLNARLTMLKAVYEEDDHRLNDCLVQRKLEYYGHRKSPDWVRTQMRALADLGVFIIHEQGDALIAEITEAGVCHCERSAFVEGIARPRARR